MKIKIIKNNKGFTLVETMFAVMILTFTIVSMMTVVANSLFAARYARDEITTSYLLQEVIDYIRNDRDTTVFLQNTQSIDTAWSTFVNKYTNCSNEDTGCYFDILSPTVTPVECSSLDGCPYLYYDENANSTPFYVSDDGMGNSGKVKTDFQRKIVITQVGDELKIVVTISWKNGSLTKTRSLSTSMMKWQS
ncbi:MAG TPA: type II secretion system protein [Candidatus Paceibacterota bacterium]|nr:type II secretion system protein [Candidatus Paceibacterota bacterium]